MTTELQRVPLYQITNIPPSTEDWVQSVPWSMHCTKYHLGQTHDHVEGHGSPELLLAWILKSPGTTSLENSSITSILSQPAQEGNVLSSRVDSTPTEFLFCPQASSFRYAHLNPENCRTGQLLRGIVSWQTTATPWFSSSPSLFEKYTPPTVDCDLTKGPSVHQVWHSPLCLLQRRSAISPLASWNFSTEEEGGVKAKQMIIYKK